MRSFFPFLLILTSGLQNSFSFIPNKIAVSNFHSRSSTVKLSMVEPTKRQEEGNLLVSKLSKISLDGPIRLILASQSPRRREILDMMGLSNRYNVTFSPLDEEALQEELSKTKITPTEYSKTLARSKAYALVEAIQKDGEEKTHSTTFVLGSDTIVDKDGIILEKPKSKENAAEMLTKLSGNWHEVHTGVALYKINHECEGDDIIELVSNYTDTARVKFSTLTNDDIAAYIETGEPMDKAGSYGIQGLGGQFVETITGDFFAVMGLPMHSLSKAFAKALN